MLPVSTKIGNADIDRARLAWRRDADRRWWGLFDARATQPEQPADGTDR
jgi:hypothetical protein